MGEGTVFDGHGRPAFDGFSGCWLAQGGGLCFVAHLCPDYAPGDGWAYVRQFETHGAKVISLITGLPGNGKTLYALAWLKAKAEKEGRTVYYSGISDLRIPGWVEADPEKWADLPKGSIIVVDEAQRVFRPRMHGTKVPDYVAALETHRHLGVDLVFITQHPMLIDSNVRRLVGQHFHVIRKFGTHWATIHEWGATKETCDKNRDDSIRHEFKYPKEVFAWYKSAELHTHKARIPFKVWLLFSMPFVLAGLGYWSWTRISPQRLPAVVGAAAPVGGAAVAPGPGGRPQKLSAADWLADQVPRVPGLAYTAPVYDQVTAVAEAPYPAACIESASKGCSCWSQQGTRLDVGDVICRQVVAKGFFVSWRPSGGDRAAPVRSADARSAAGPSGAASAPAARVL